ncbi:uncharacterized protein LOC127723499 [Mytilus californianus]|uniref:uncharacterized protein LOC127723499 n=1 Tax=Mytilus californianus TaxID=6549 RepID=UPI0022451B18|nr:uncharacterized protein LOC127723499 [Mytilus californianus]
MAGLLADVPRMVIGGIIISALSLILHVIGFSTTYWYKPEDTGHFGLWKTCGQAQKGVPEICIDNEDFSGSLLNDNFKAARALECLALVSFIAALTSAVLKIVVLKEKGILNFVAGLVNLMAGGLTLIGLCVFATMQLFGGVKLDSTKFHYSFGLCIVGGIGGLISGIVFIIAWRK